MKPPRPANPVATAAAQASQNTMAANANTYAQSGNVTNPYGRRSSELESMNIINPLTGLPERVFRNNITETLSPEQQAIFNQNQASGLNLATYGNNQTQELLKLGASPFQYTSGDHEASFARNYDALNNEGNAQADEALRSRMAAQGLKMGSSAYDREMKTQAAGQGNARLNALVGAQQQGYQQALSTRNQRFNEPLAISTGTQLQAPNFNPANVGNVATTDYAGIRANYDQQRMGGFNATQAMIGGLFSGLGGAAAAMSDRRAKENIEEVGKIKGEKIYSFSYKDGLGQPKGLQLGVMAQDIEKRKPHAVTTGQDGYKRVNYPKALSLGV